MFKKTIGLASVAMCAVLVGVAWAQDTVDVQSLPFSAARQAGNTLYVSGQIAVGTDGTPNRGDIGAQTMQVMENLNQALTANGYTMNDVVKVTVFLSDMDHYAGMNAAYRTWFDGAFPARECVGGLEIAFDTDVEISCIAYKE